MPADWIFGLIGGLLIGAAGASYLLTNGRVMGASGIIGGLVDGSARSTALERIAFLFGLAGVPFIAVALGKDLSTQATTSWPILIVAGLLVGLGTRLANGCTSGHGVCGISRLNLRGIVATLVYIAAGALVMLAFRHGLGVI